MLTKLAIFWTIGCLVWSYFEPSLASIVFIIFFVLFEGYVIYLSLTGRTRCLEEFTAPFYLNTEEFLVVKRYRLFFNEVLKGSASTGQNSGFHRHPYAQLCLYYPMSFRDFSSVCSVYSIAAVVWMNWLFYHGLWLHGLMIVANFYIVYCFVVKLDPIESFERASGVKALHKLAELDVINTALKKLLTKGVYPVSSGR